MVLSGVGWAGYCVVRRGVGKEWCFVVRNTAYHNCLRQHQARITGGGEGVWPQHTILPRLRNIQVTSTLNSFFFYKSAIQSLDCLLYISISFWSKKKNYIRLVIPLFKRGGLSHHFLHRGNASLKNAKLTFLNFL